MELCKGGTILERVKIQEHTERRIATILRSVLRFVAQCHAKGIIYRDVKPDNVRFAVLCRLISCFFWLKSVLLEIFQNACTLLSCGPLFWAYAVHVLNQRRRFSGQSHRFWAVNQASTSGRALVISQRYPRYGLLYIFHCFIPHVPRGCLKTLLIGSRAPV